MFQYRALLFDIDGTLVDSNAAHASAWVDVLREYGHAVAHDQVRPLIGMGGDKVLPRLTGIDPESPLAETIATRRGDIFKLSYLPGLRPTRGAGDLVRFLKAAGTPLAVATSAKEDEVHALLAVAGVDGVFDEASSSDDAERSKPDPDIIHAALAKIGHPAGEVVMVGDTPYDIEAAHRAGVACVALRCGGWWTDDAFTGALAIYDDPADLLGRLRGRPEGSAGGVP